MTNEFYNLAADPRFTLFRFQQYNQLKQWNKETRNPLSEPAGLAEFTNDVDLIIRTHPEMDDAKDKSIRWKYPAYFQEYIRSVPR